MRAENIALVFQEVLTAIVRLRAKRQQSNDADSFRYHIKEAVNTAARNAHGTNGYSAGYSVEHVRMSTLALVGFMDESVLNSGNPIFAEWAQKTLQHEYFNTQTAGEVFFENVTKLLAQSDSADLADLLELHYLCLLLGFTGKYGGGRVGELSGIRQAIGERIERIRGVPGDLSPAWASAGEKVSKPKPASLRGYVIAAIAAVLLTAILFTVFHFGLSAGVAGLQAMAGAKELNHP